MHALPAAAPRLATCCAVLLLAGCATTGQPTPGDPWESANRSVFAFNDGVDRAALKPTARGYVKVTPRWMRTMVGNFFTNLEYPITIVNQVLQGKLKEAGTGHAALHAQHHARAGRVLRPGQRRQPAAP